MSLASGLFKAARAAATVRSFRSPASAARRGKNIAVGRALGRAGVWRGLWR